MRRIIPAVTLAAAAALLLAGCAGGAKQSDSSGAKPSASASSAAAASGCALKSGDQSDAVTATGERGTEPQVKVPAGQKADSAQRTVLQAGSGTAAKTGATVFGAFTIYDSTSGKRIDAEGYGGTPSLQFAVGTGQTIPMFDDLFGCLKPGSRAVLTETASAAFGASGDPTQLGIATGDSIAIVGDLLYVAPDLPASAKADGADQSAKPGFPTVKLAASGQPTLTIAKGLAAPTSTQVETLKKGTGATVKSGDFVTVQYQGVNWRTGEVFDQSWGRAVATFQTNAVVAGFTKGLVGQTVGSQVVTMMPPADGYGTAGNSAAGIQGTDSLVFVVDILAAGSAK